MRADSLYPDEMFNSIFELTRRLVQDKGMTLVDAISEIESKTYTPLPSFIKNKLYEESFHWGITLDKS